MSPVQATKSIRSKPSIDQSPESRRLQPSTRDLFLGFPLEEERTIQKRKDRGEPRYGNKSFTTQRKSINRCEAISLTLSKLEKLSPPSNQSIRLHQRGRNRSSMPKPTFLGQNQFNVSKITTTLPKWIIFIEINDNDTTVLNLDAGSVRQKKRIEFGQSKRLSVTSKGHPGHRRVAMELSRGDGPQGSRLSHQQSVDQERIPQPDSEVSDEEHQVR